MARVGLGRLEYLMERMDRNIDLEGSDITVNTLTSDLGVTVTAGGVTVTAGGVGVTAGGIAVAAGGIGVTAGGVTVVAGRYLEKLTVSDVNAQHHTLTAANVNKGILVYTSTTGGGTLTMPTAATIIAGEAGVGALTADGHCVTMHLINDGDQTITLAADGGATCTIADTGNTILTNESTTLLFRRTGAAALTVYSLS